MASNRSRSRSPKRSKSPRKSSPHRRPEKEDSAHHGGENEKNKFDEKELKKITVKICRPNLQKELTDLKRAIVNPDLIAPVRRPDEGKKPIFDRPELKNGPRVLVEDPNGDHRPHNTGEERRHRDRSRSRGRHHRSSRSRERYEKRRRTPSRPRSHERRRRSSSRHRSYERRKRSRSPSRPRYEDRKASTSYHEENRDSGKNDATAGGSDKALVPVDGRRSRSRSRSKSRRDGRRRSRERSGRDRSRSHEEYYDDYHEGDSAYRAQGMMMRAHPMMMGYPPPRAMIPYMPMPGPGYRPPFPPPRFFPRF